MENNLAEGIYFFKPHEKAPDFVKGSMSIDPDKFIKWLQEQKKNNKGYVNVDILESKNDPSKLYGKLNDFEPKSQNAEVPKEVMDDDYNDLPF